MLLLLAFDWVQPVMIRLLGRKFGHVGRQKRPDLLSRHFFWGKKGKEDAAEGELLGGTKADNSGSQLLSPTGDDAPKLNPILILPTTRQPIFPHTYAPLIVKDERVVNAIQEVTLTLTLTRTPTLTLTLTLTRTPTPTPTSTSPPPEP